MHVEDKMMTSNLAKTLVVLTAFMFAIIVLANFIA